MAELEPMRRSSSSSSTGRGAVTLFFEVLPRTDDFAVALAFAADDEGCAGDEVTMIGCRFGNEEEDELRGEVDDDGWRGGERRAKLKF